MKRVILIIGLIVGCCIAVSAQTKASVLASCEAYRDVQKTHKEFRNKFPYHYQCVAINQYQDGSNQILISEPSPTVSIDDLNKAFGSYEYTSSVLQHKIGYDGYIKDVIYVVKGIDQNTLKAIVSQLHKLVHYSEYKSDKAMLCLSESRGRRYFSDSGLNRQITLAELDNIFIKTSPKQVKFIGKNGVKLSVNQLLNGNETGVYFSENANNGVVAWVIDKNRSLQDQKQHIRQFALDSDLILGGIANNNKLIIIAEERILPLEELPPLCVESVLLLASCSQINLEQSLDSQDLLAGRIYERKYDWIPTYLSPQLENTEFGDLLTITDIILKNWSENGQCEELDFKYPAPRVYPFSKPLTKMMYGDYMVNEGRSEKGSRQVLYNWNTDNVVTSYQTAGTTMKIYSINGTGSLTVSYFKDVEGKNSAGKDFDSMGTKYFATINNTDLARAMQYYSLYSIFSDNHILGNNSAAGVNQKNAAAFMMQPEVRTLLTGLADASDDALSRIATNLIKDVICDEYQFNDGIDAGVIRLATEHLNKELKRQGLTMQTVDRSSYDAAYEATLKIFHHQIDSVVQNQSRLTYSKLSEVRNMLKNMKQMEFDATCRMLAYPRQCTMFDNMNAPSSAAINVMLHEAILLTRKDVFKNFGVNLGNVMDGYSKGLQTNSSTWIKTPTLIRSYVGNMAVGGHNLSPKISIVKSLSEIPQRVFSERITTVRSLDEIIPTVSRTHRGL